MYFDRDIDSITEARNTSRPSVASGSAHSIASTSARRTGVASHLGPWALLAGLLGLAIDVLLRAALLKRRTPLSVVVGGFAGRMLALVGGKGAYSGGMPFTFLIAFWSATHIWLLAAYFRGEYARAGAAGRHR